MKALSEAPLEETDSATARSGASFSSTPLSGPLFSSETLESPRPIINLATIEDSPNPPTRGISAQSEANPETRWPRPPSRALGDKDPETIKSRSPTLQASDKQLLDLSAEPPLQTGPTSVMPSAFEHMLSPIRELTESRSSKTSSVKKKFSRPIKRKTRNKNRSSGSSNR